MSLGQVSRTLDVNEATLRQWADRGRLPVYRTPGGHRRFLREDVEGLLHANPGHANGNPGAGASAAVAAPTPPIPSPVSAAPDSEELALRRIRRKLGQLDPAAQTWLEGFQAEGRDRMRLFGRRLLSLLVQDGLTGRRGRRKDETLSESHLLGHEYGAAMADRAVSLSDSVQAFLFFRQAVVEAVPPERLRQVIEISDRVLLGLVDAYAARLPDRTADANRTGPSLAEVSAAFRGIK